MTVKPASFEPALLPPVLFEPDQTDPYLAKAVELRNIFALDAVERDQQGGRPTEQVRLLKGKWPG
ncbi:hypothetical protein QO004_003008 [Rhizobium mesoamericanum]|nr:hypothetical protein [Rhizobium mesoamericanum]